MADDANEAPPPAEEEQAPKARGKLLKPIVIVAGLALVQVGVAVLVITLARKTEVKPAPPDPGAPTGEAPAEKFAVVDLGTYNLTHYSTGASSKRVQLAVNLAVSLKRDEADEGRQAVTEQKIWIGQLLDEMIGAMSMDALHVTKDRESLKQRLKTSINLRLGDDVAQEVILRVQTFGA